MLDAAVVAYKFVSMMMVSKCNLIIARDELIAFKLDIQKVGIIELELLQ